MVGGKTFNKNIHIADAVIRPIAKTIVVNSHPCIEKLAAHIPLAVFASLPIIVGAVCGARISAIIVKIFNGQIVINAGEIFYITQRKEGAEKAALVWKGLMQFPIHILDADLDFTLAAAKLKAKYSISYADAFAASLTIKRKAILITGDDGFNAMVNEAGFKIKHLYKL